MNPTVLGPTVQEFLGVRYYRCASGYFYRNHRKGVGPRRLQRAVYSTEFCNIPHGWEVHHKDEDKSNNVLDNLECLPPLEHRKKHREQRRALLIARNVLPRPKYDHVCTVCSAAYQATKGGKPTRFCSATCETRARRARKKEALNAIT